MFNRDVYKDKSAPAFALLGITLKKYGVESLEYDPELLRHQIEKDYDIHLEDIQMDKLQAAMAVMLTDSFYTDWRVFETTCHLFHNEPVIADLLNPLDAEDIAVGIAEAAMIKMDTGSTSEDLIFDQEVRAYAGRIFHDYGLFKAPKIFPSAILPKGAGNADNDADKNAGLKELFDAHTEHIVDYVERI
jgi:hypothetical protein